MPELGRAHGARAQTSKERPAYSIQSVDNALRLAAALQTEGSISVSDAARRLGVAASTAHRLLSMLVYRDFATHEGHGNYHRGPLLNSPWATMGTVATLREVAQPHLESLAGKVRETCNIEIRVADHMRFIASAEGSQTIRISSREGMSFPLHRTSGGLILLAGMTPEQLATLYDPARFHRREHELPDMGALHRELDEVRKTWTAINLERSESGIAAIAVPVRSGHSDAVEAAIAVSLPVSRYNPRTVARLRDELRATAADIRTDLSLAG